MKLLSLVVLILGFSNAIFAEEDCTHCHTQMTAKKVKHAAVEMGCTNCHAEHGQNTGNPFRLTQKLNDLCFQCHDPVAMRLETGHWIQGHPVSRPQDPLYPEKAFTCVSCHNPHSSNQEKLFRYNNHAPAYKPAGYNACAVCHWEITVGGPRPPRPPWND